MKGMSTENSGPLTGSPQTGGKVMMTTLSDTDEGRARPSVWPVYVAAGVVLIAGVWILVASGIVLLALITVGLEQPRPVPAWFGGLYVLASTAYGLFGVITAIGMIRLRPWAWWCALAWLWVFISSGFLVLADAAFVAGSYMDDFPMFPADARRDAELTFSLGGPVWLITVVLLIWTLSTRRRLFFPPKPAGEE